MKAVEKWAAANPLYAARFALDHPAGAAMRTAVETIGKVWAKSDPREAMNFAASRPGTFADLLARSTFKTWAEKDLTEAAAWLASADTSSRNRMSVVFVEGWAKADPHAALGWCAENLAGSVYAEAVGAVAKSAAERNVEDAAGLVNALGPSAARQHAAVAVGQKWLPSWNDQGKSADPKALDWLAGLDNASLSKVLSEVQWHWAGSDPKGFADFLTTLKSIDLPSSAFHSLSAAMARQDPAGAMEWAERLPSGSRLSAAGQVFQEWWRSQPDSALSWFRELPANDPRRNILFTGIMFSVAHDPHGPAQLAKMNAAERAAAEKFIPTVGMPEEHRKNLLAALRENP
jgi:hypothetical protein